MNDGSRWFEAATPTWMKPVEPGRRMRPEHESALADIEVTTDKWSHVCSCRFGDARPAGAPKWSGDSHRYDIFVERDGANYAIRREHGGGIRWFLPGYLNRDVSPLVGFITTVSDEARRWDYCYQLCEGLDSVLKAAARDSRDEVYRAFSEGRLQKRKVRGQNAWKVQVKPRLITKSSAQGGAISD